MGLIFYSFCVNDLDFQDRGCWVVGSDCCCVRDGCLDVVSKSRGSQLSIGWSYFEEEVACVLADQSLGIKVLKCKSFDRAAERLTNVGRVETTVFGLNCTSRITSVKRIVVSIITVC